MNNDFVEKNVAYQEEIQQIAKFVFHAFYYDEEEKAMWPGGGPDAYERDSVSDLLPKAEKILSFFGSAADAKKAMRFLHTINPMRAKDIIDEL